MVNKNFDDTQEIQTSGGNSLAGGRTQPVRIGDTQSLPVKKPKRWRVVLFGLLFLLLLSTAGAGLGYLRGIQQRLNRENEDLLTQAAIQFQYGVQQLEAGNYELARTHFEYVLQIYPDFPGFTEKYTEVMVRLAQQSKDALEPAVTPTVDNRGAEALFNQALQEVQSQQWAAAVNTLEALRNTDYTYRTLEVDGLYYTALRYRAVDMIVNEGDLEEGLYFMAILKQYAPLDNKAVNYGNWAQLYLTGASYWDLDWEQVVIYFNQLYAAFPNMHDGTGWTAAGRFMEGSERYADQLAESGEYCKALDFYRNVLSISAIENVQGKYDQVYLICHPPTAIPQPTQTPEPEVILTEVTPTEGTVTIEPTATATTATTPS